MHKHPQFRDKILQTPSLSLSLSSLRKYKIELFFSFYLCPFVIVRFNCAEVSPNFCKRNKDAVARSRFDIQIRVSFIVLDGFVGHPD